MVKDIVFGAGHPKVCLGFTHGHITAVAPVLVCMRWMAQSFRGQGWREGFGVAIAIGGRETSCSQSVEERKKNKKKHANFGKSGCATSAFSQQVLSLKHVMLFAAISELDSLREESGSVS